MTRSAEEILRDFDSASSAELMRAHDQLSRETSAPGLSVFILRNITVEAALPIWSLAGHAAGLRLAWSHNPFDAYRQSALAPPPELVQAQLVVVLLWLESLPLQANWSEELIATVDDVLARCRATVLLATFARPIGLGDDDPVHERIDAANRAIREYAAIHPRVRLLDLARLCERFGAERAVDARSYFRYAAPLGDSLARAVGRVIAQVAAELAGRSKKVLVVDADNTLWGGVLGEDGIDGIKLGSTGSPDAAFERVQLQLLAWRARGVLLGLATKNDLSLIEQAFAQHPGMRLSLSDFSNVKANWGPKSSSLRQMAAELNLGLDSFVFVDDSKLECAEVRAALPMVQVLEMPADARGIVSLLAHYTGFSRASATEEDRMRADHYQTEKTRDAERARHTDLDSFLESLQLSIEIGPAKSDELERIAQLTQRTNQFNLTTRRRSLEEIRALSEDPAWDIVALKVTDCYGAYGLTGCAIIHYGDTGAHIDSFMLSCRVLGRRIEDALLREVIERALSRSDTLSAECRFSEKNQQVRDFYPARGFVSRSASEAHEFFALSQVEVITPPSIEVRKRTWKPSKLAFVA